MRTCHAFGVCLRVAVCVCASLKCNALRERELCVYVYLLSLCAPMPCVFSFVMRSCLCFHKALILGLTPSKSYTLNPNPKPGVNSSTESHVQIVVLFVGGGNVCMGVSF